MIILEWVLQGLLAVIFLMAGCGKVAGLKMSRESFVQWRSPPFFRILKGLLELMAAFLLIIGFWQKDFAMAGVLLIAVTAIGGTITRIPVKDEYRKNG